MLLKILAVARALSALANTEAFQAFIAILQEAFKDREPLFGSSADNAEAQEFKALCAQHGVPDGECDQLCDRICNT